MFQSFTGNSRRPRQVNLGARNTNPFAAFPSPSSARLPGHGHGPAHNTLAVAQQERLLRQQERSRLHAARMIQRTWRGYQSRKHTHSVWRTEWDGTEANGYVTADECLAQLRLLVQFVEISKSEDVQRLVAFGLVLQSTLPSEVSGEWTVLLTRLARISLAVLRSLTCVNPLLELLVFLARLISKQMAHIDEYYPVMAILTRNVPPDTILLHAILAPLQPITSETLAAYASFAKNYLTIPDLPSSLVDGLADNINYKLLTSAMEPWDFTQVDTRLWLLAYFVYFYCHARGGKYASPEPGFVKIVSRILNPIALSVSRRLEFSNETPLPPFVKEQITSLLNQKTITGLLSPRHEEHADEARLLATYALTLLRIFPRRGDDIRMWLYLGSAGTIPAIKYFWQASRSSRIFQSIRQNSSNAMPLLKSTPVETGTEWTVILLFLELYTFVLKVMDDEQFFSGSSPFAQASWTRESALPLKDVGEMTLFLKNLAFALYWNAAELNEAESPPESTSIRNYFNATVTEERNNKDNGLPGVTGIPLDYFRGLVTGLLRMIHERDSRRKFLPDGHWLMTSHFDMEGFIPAVVAEEESRHQLQEDDEDQVMSDGEAEDEDEPFLGLVGTGRVQQIRRIEALRRRQQAVARRRQLQAVAPRLEILRNMPFFIPFATRVQIFREFIYRDQMRRRHGFVDPDAWRMSVAQASMGRMTDNTLSKHHANIHRESVFDDAFDEFYDLGEGLKEPIQITFIDRFDTVEAGIDGGGVTKEFLTSVTNEAFKSPPTASRSQLFDENDQHLLYPRPTSVEERKQTLKELGFVEGTTDYNEGVRDLLRRYEFLGRVIGKCLYEGILVDVSFAPFFLLKWALTGGAGSAQRESAYRASINDLKDLDERLYLGLVSGFPLHGYGCVFPFSIGYFHFPSYVAAMLADICLSLLWLFPLLLITANHMMIYSYN